ncbi:MAG TPA: glycosyltransferase family 39 protein [Candidatus Kapabacteria bacterium]|nr:glycosyltransferase family 39 protein [Candidatus Kapabacteria bacterium]HPO62605.1 glycosyltransferase family 39 protein [Candidatus Kapabacteria bacterium]
MAETKIIKIIKFNNNILTTISVITFLGFITFLHLINGEVQPNDEGQLAIQTHNCINSGMLYEKVLNQNTISGYSPISIVSMAASFNLFGESTFAIRFFTALCSLVSLVFVYLLARRLVNEETSSIAVLLTFGTESWNLFSRQANSELPFLCFALISLWSVLKITETNLIKAKILYLFIFILTFLLCLLTKLNTAFIPILFIFPIVFSKTHWKNAVALLFSSVFSITSFFLLYYYVFQITPDSILSHFTNYSINFDLKNFFGGINQLIINNAVAVIPIIFFILSIFNRKKLRLESNLAFKILTIWFIAAFLIFSIFTFKETNGQLYFILPIIILAVYFFEHFSAIFKRNTHKSIFISFLILSAVWSYLIFFRYSINDYFLFNKNLPFLSILMIILLTVVFIIPFLLTNKSKEFLTKTFKTVFYIVLYAVMLKAIIFNSFYPVGNSAGAVSVANYIERTTPSCFIYLYHNLKPADSLNSQLAWYLNQLSDNGGKKKVCKPIPLNKEKLILREVFDLIEFKEDIIVYYISDDMLLSLSIFNELVETRELLLQTKNYLVFSKVVRGATNYVFV